MSDITPERFEEIKKSVAEAERIVSQRHSELSPATLLACGHPGQPNNLKGGACGTCCMVADLERMANESSTPNLRRILRALANQFRSGNVLYDTNGKSFLEWEKTMRPQANAPGERPPPDGVRTRPEA